MSKELKDYLHLYLGCECNHPSDLAPFLFVGINSDGKPLLKGDWSGGTHNITQIGWVEWGDFKLTLRPLSDMTDEEVMEICRVASPEVWGDYRFNKWEVKKSPHKELFHWDVTNKGTTDVFCVSSIDGDVDVYCDGGIDPTCIDSNYRFWYLRKGFDIFDLIEEGLAIDKTKNNTLK